MLWMCCVQGRGGDSSAGHQGVLRNWGHLELLQPQGVPGSPAGGTQFPTLPPPLAKRPVGPWLQTHPCSGKEKASAHV